MEPGRGLVLQDRRPRPDLVNPAVEDSNEFAIALYRQLRQQRANLFFSPFSIRTALAMARDGARGDTAAQMNIALRHSTTDDELHTHCAGVSRRLNVGGGGRYEMAVANALWAQDGTPLQPGFVDLMARHYDATVDVVDFRGSADAAHRTINQWVEDRTRQRIQELVPPGGLSDVTRLILANAVYFKGTWVLPFYEAATRREAFFPEGGGTAQVLMMRQTDDIAYFEADEYQAVDLAYEGGDLSMLVLLPRRRHGLEGLEAAMSARVIGDCITRTVVREVHLFLPRMTFSWGADLRDALAAAGMPIAFTQAADFSGINGHEPPDEEALFISAVYHRAFVGVNEQGTEAGAATALFNKVGSALKPPPIPTFRADHPFLFAIYDRTSRVILFLGRVADVTQES